MIALHISAIKLVANLMQCSVFGILMNPYGEIPMLVVSNWGKYYGAKNSYYK